MDLLTERQSRAAIALCALLSGCSSNNETTKTTDTGNTETPSSWASWPMPNPESAALPNPARYTLTTDDSAVLDELTGLMWQRHVDAGPGEGAGFIWPSASPHCEDLSLSGFTGWRLPTRIELVSLVDFTRSEPAIDPQAFPDTPTTWTWTSSLAADPTNFAWYVNFYYGYTNSNDRVYSQQVRCVRTARPPTPLPGAARYELGPDTARDLRTGLTWQRQIALEHFSASGAEAHCVALELDGMSGFRLPSMKELQTLVDEERLDPAIDVEAFPDTPSEQFWTSSRWADGAEQAWFVLFYDGYALYTDANVEYRARCVR